MSRHLFCSGQNCPDKETCALYFAHYMDELDKTKMNHFAEPPYDHKRTRPYKSTGTNCGYYEKQERIDDFINDINSIE